MFRLLVTSIMMMLSCVPSQLSNLDRWGGSASVQGQDYNYCEATDSVHKVSFDFGDEVTVSGNVFYCTLIDDFVEEPIISHSGTIGLEIISSAQNSNYIKLTLPDADGRVDINFAGDGKDARVSLFSSKGENGQYAISSLSQYSAWGLVGNIPGQEYMDNDTVDAEDRGPTPEFSETRPDGPRRAIASGRVYGYLKWKDDAGNIHPLSGAKVKLTFSGSFGDASTYTNSSGYFDINFSDIWTLWAYECDIHIYAENSMAKVTNKNGTVYEKAHRLSDMSNGSTYNYGTYVFSTNSDGDLGSAMQIFTALKNYSDYARTLNGGNSIDQCRVIYPTDVADAGAYYSNNVIHLGRDSQRQTDCPSLPGSWDVIGHEYGHHLQSKYFYHNYGGEHESGKSDIQKYFEVNGITSPTDSDIRRAKTHGIGQAWSESWPTFFAISAQSTFNSDLKRVPTVGDARYDAFNGPRYSLLNDCVYKGEACERTIMCFLYRLWDADNLITCDRISISDSDLWAIMSSTNPEHFYGFIDALFNSGLVFSRSDLGLLLEGFRLSSSNVSVAVSMDNYHSLPTFSWTANGGNIVFNGTTYNYGNNKFIISFYDSDLEYIGECETMNTSIQISSDLWKNIIAAPGNTYFVRIESYATLGGETGPYFSGYHEFTKPAAAQETISITNSRYYERDIAIAPGTEYTFNVTFDYSGTKLIQTFGTTDVVMSLYEPDGTTLIITSDDEGYGRNSLIYRYLLSDTQYVLKLRVFGNVDGGLTRLCIAPIYGAQADSADNMNEFENFVNLNTYHNWGWGSYLATMYSKMITWTVPENGTYKLSLTSEFDNYLYVVDPTSPYANVFDVNYNDDDEGTNASITNYYRGGKTYAIFYCQYYPASAIGNGEISADISLSISKIS